MIGDISVTVLMTVYNGGKYLQMAVESILTQTYKDFEFLIINDCSTDDSLEIIKSFNDKRIRIHNNTCNMGQTKSLNVGLDMASGGYIARIDADDIALPQWLEKQTESIKAVPDCSVMSTYVFAIDEQNRVKKFYKPPLDREGVILRSLIASPINHVGSIFAKKDIMEKGGYDERYITAADYALWGKLLRDGFKITTTPEMLVAIREHSQSLSRSKRGTREIKEIMEIVSANINKFTDIKLSDGDVELFCRANYDEGNLTVDEFNKAVDITKAVYMNFIPAQKAGSGRVSQWTRQRCMTIYLKRIFFLIDQKAYESVRKLSRKAMKEFGALNIFVIFFGASLLRGMVLNFIPGLYNKILRQKARFQLGAQLDAEMFH